MADPKKISALAAAADILAAEFLVLQGGANKRAPVSLLDAVYQKQGQALAPVVTNGIAVAATQTLSGANAQSILALAATWNTSGTPTALDVDVTDTASNAASLLANFKVGGASMFWLSKDGRLRIGSGSEASPAFSFNSDTNTGIFNRTADVLAFATAGTNRFELTTDSFRMSSNMLLSWSSAGAGAAAGDVVLARDASAILGLRNGANAQTLRVYKSYTDASNYERFSIGSSAFSFDLVSESGGSGSQKNIRLGSNSSVPYVSIFTNAIERIQVTATGLIALGQPTASYPALKRSSAVAEFKLGDDSAYTQVNMLDLAIVDGMTAPSATAGLAKLFVDVADGDLKVIFGDGTIKTIVVDT